MISKLCLLLLCWVDNLYIFNLLLLLNMNFVWFGCYLVYIMVKYGMSLCVLGMVDEYVGKVGVNVFWLCMVINIVVVCNYLGGEMVVWVVC